MLSILLVIYRRYAPRRLFCQLPPDIPSIYARIIIIMGEAPIKRRRPIHRKQLFSSAQAERQWQKVPIYKLNNLFLLNNSSSYLGVVSCTVGSASCYKEFYLHLFRLWLLQERASHKRVAWQRSRYPPMI